MYNLLKFIFLCLLLGLTACGGGGNSSSGEVNSPPRDSDGDGILDIEDAFPNDVSESKDSDGDGVGDNADPYPFDQDNDGVADVDDSFPLDPNESVDSDGDGVGDNADEFKDDPAEWADSDHDGVGDNADVFPLDSFEHSDADGDGVGDNEDAFPDDSAESVDSDGDGVGNVGDVFPFDSAEQKDTDGDGFGDHYDEMPEDERFIADMDADGVADEFDRDADGDGERDLLSRTAITISKYEFEGNENIHLSILGVTSTGRQALDNFEDGWNVQYRIFKVGNPDIELRRYADIGYYNGDFDENKKRWNIDFPAPDAEGDYYIKVAFYCSVIDSECDQNREDSYYKDVHFSVYCPDSGCADMRGDEPGVRVTRTLFDDYDPQITRLPSNELMVMFTRWSEDDAQTMVVFSDDEGKTWGEEKSVLPGFHYPPAVTVSESGKIVTGDNCDENLMCLAYSYNGRDWTRIPIDKASGLHGCNEINCINKLSFGGAIDDGNGYLVVYQFERDIYVSRRSNTRKWSEPINLTNTPSDEAIVLDPIIMQDSTGTYWISYNSYPLQSLVVLRSEDGVNWEEAGFAYLGFTLLGIEQKLMETTQGVVLHYSITGGLYQYNVTGNEVGPVVRLTIDDHNRRSSIINDEGNILSVFSAFHYDHSDIFFQEINRSQPQ